MHFWRDGHFTNISSCRMWRARVGIQVFRRKFHTHIHLDQVRIKFLSCKKIIKKKKKKLKVVTQNHIFSCFRHCVQPIFPYLWSQVQKWKATLFLFLFLFSFWSFCQIFVFILWFWETSFSISSPFNCNIIVINHGRPNRNSPSTS